MALVAYDNSDSSDYEDDEESKPVVLLNNKPAIKQEPKTKPEPITQTAIKQEPKTEPEPITQTSIKQEPKIEPKPIIETAIKIKEEDEPQTNGPTLFNLLPQPTNKIPAVIEEDDEFLHKKEVGNTVKPKAKITVPSLSDFKDVEHSIPAAKPKAANGKKSGLLSILPQPRNGVKATNTTLLPQALMKKPAPTVKTEIVPTPVKKPKVEPAPLINDYSDDSDNDEVQNDFFSIHKPVEVPDIVDLPLDVEHKIKTDPTSSLYKPKGIEAFFKKEEEDQEPLEPDYGSTSTEQYSDAGSSYNGYEAEASNSNEMELDEEAIMKLCGTRGKRKREEIQIVDVNQQQVLADAREMLLKGLMDDTSKRVSASKKKGNEPSAQQRRKHQITYLAFQAKANEAELQNQWANNRMSKRQTQAKYGF